MTRPYMISGNITLPASGDIVAGIVMRNATIQEASPMATEATNTNEVVTTEWELTLTSYIGESLCTLATNRTSATFDGYGPNSIEDIADKVDWNITTTEFTETDRDDDDNAEEVRLWFESNTSVEDPLTGDPIQLRHELYAMRDTVNIDMLHDIPGRETECHCDMCKHGLAKVRLNADIDRLIDLMKFHGANSDSVEVGPFQRSKTSASWYIPATSDDAPIPASGDVVKPAFHNIISHRGETLGSTLPDVFSLRTSGLPVTSIHTYKDTDGKDRRFSFGEVSEAILDKLRELHDVGSVSIIAEDSDTVLFSTKRNFRHYKVVDAEGNAVNGGNFAYSLPTQDEDTGEWTPGDWTPDVDPISMCSKGYHTTMNPSVWYQYGRRVFEVEAEGTAATIAGDKLCSRRIRLVREVDMANNFEMPATMTRIIRNIRDHIAPAVERAKTRNEAGLPEWATADNHAYRKPGEENVLDVLTIHHLGDKEEREWYRFGEGLIMSYLSDHGVSAGAISALADATSAVLMHSDLSDTGPYYARRANAEVLALWRDVVGNGYAPVGSQGAFGKIIVRPLHVAG